VDKQGGGRGSMRAYANVAQRYPPTKNREENKGTPEQRTERRRVEKEMKENCALEKRPNRCQQQKCK